MDRRLIVELVAEEVLDAHVGVLTGVDEDVKRLPLVSRGPGYDLPVLDLGRGGGRDVLGIRGVRGRAPGAAGGGGGGRQRSGVESGGGDLGFFAAACRDEEAQDNCDGEAAEVFHASPPCDS